MWCFGLQWLNALVEEIWPFLDKAICNMIKVRVRSRGVALERAGARWLGRRCWCHFVGLQRSHD